MDESRILPGFEDLDKADVYRKSEDYIAKEDARNFAVEYDSDLALVALDLDTTAVEALLKTPSTRTRWINLWSPELQKPTVAALAKHYKFSPRLAALMRTVPDKPVVAAMENHQRRRDRVIQRWKLDRPSFESQAADVEMMEGLPEPASHATNPNLNHYRIVNEVWYYYSMDWGSKYLCVGYNSLSQLDSDHVDATRPSDQMQSKPHAKRLWSWLIICDDRTIITINETPSLGSEVPVTATEGAKFGDGRLQILRRNLVNVFKNLSKSNNEWREHNPIMTLPIRAGLPGMEEGDERASDGSSLLFYYLFDDWYTTYSLVAKQEHQYGKQLGQLRKLMFRKPLVDHIEKLHCIGQQLSVLKKIYQSYALIIERILERQKPVDLSTSTQLLKENIDEDTSMLTAQTRSYAVSLSSAATVRFERLRDRIQLYALSEIQECIDEKEALVFLNFSLITLKQSNAVEKLTRITILLAKVTILFMPVSLMTAYFSVQIDDLQGVYTSKTYWICFAVIVTLSFIFLVIFGMLSDTLEGTPVYKSVARASFESSRKFLGFKKKTKTAFKSS